MASLPIKKKMNKLWNISKDIGKLQKPGRVKELKVKREKTPSQVS